MATYTDTLGREFRIAGHVASDQEKDEFALELLRRIAKRAGMTEAEIVEAVHVAEDAHLRTHGRPIVEVSR